MYESGSNHVCQSVYGKAKEGTYKYKASNKTLTISGKYLKGKLPEGMMGAYDETIRYDYKWSSLSGKVKKVVLKKVWNG